MPMTIQQFIEELETKAGQISTGNSAFFTKPVTDDVRNIASYNLRVASHELQQKNNILMVKLLIRM